MPSPLHEAFVTFFNTHHESAIRLAAGLGLDLRAPSSHWRLVSGSFGDPGLSGKQFEADIVLAAFPSNTDSAPTLSQVDSPALAALVVEPQLGFEPEKAVSWLVYRAGVGARYGTCPQWVLMLTPIPSLPLTYQRQVYPDQAEHWPLFVTAGSVTPVLDQDLADEDPAWAALCAAMHARGPQAVPTAKVALQACASLPADARRCTFQLIIAGLRKADMQRIRQELPETTQREWTLTEYEREGCWFQEGREEGLEQGLEQGLRTSLLQVLTTRELETTPEQRAQIDACSDLDRLQRWLVRAVQATSTAEALAD